MPGMSGYNDPLVDTMMGMGGPQQAPGGPPPMSDAPPSFPQQYSGGPQSQGPPMTAQGGRGMDTPAEWEVYIQQFTNAPPEVRQAAMQGYWEWKLGGGKPNTGVRPAGPMRQG